MRLFQHGPTIIAFVTLVTSVSFASGYKFCRNEGNSENFCIRAFSGYPDCRKSGYSANYCLRARAGYKDCLKDLLSFTGDNIDQASNECLGAGAGYRECVSEGSFSDVNILHRFCRQAN